ncbi:MAG: ABC transporter substrate-binding protein [Casimicrobiaceae bacterium]
MRWKLFGSCVHVAVCAMLAVALACAPASAADMRKVLRIASPDITSLDPQQGTDLYSTRIAQAIFEPLYQYDYFASPATVIPDTAASMPVITGGGRTWTITLQKGILFADDPAFKGKPRELVAQDYVYSITRSLDPNLRGGGDPDLTDLIVGARTLVDAARKPGGKLDYDAPIAGLRALDRYTLQIRLTRPDYTLLDRLAQLGAYAVAREAIEAAGDQVMMKPVGTGPYQLSEWKRGSRIVLTANPHYRTIAFPTPTTDAQRVIAAPMHGIKLPQIGRIEISIIEELVPEFLSFDRDQLDYAVLGSSVLDRLLVDGKLKPSYAARGIRHVRWINPSLAYTYFNMDDPVVGGYDNAHIALRRAIALGFDTPTFIKVLFNGEALPANQLLPPGVRGHDDSLPAQSGYDPAAARALLDRFGYEDRNGDGFREQPDGKPLVLAGASTPDSLSRESDTLWQKDMAAIGIKFVVKQAPFADLIKQARAGQLMMFNLGARSLEPTGWQILSQLYGKSTADTNLARFRNKDYDAAYEAFLRTPDGPARTALARRMSELVEAYAPWFVQVYQIGDAFVQPWVLGYYPSDFGFSWKYLDIDVAKRDAALKAMKR